MNAPTTIKPFDLTAILDRAAAMMHEGCMAEAHRTTICDYCKADIAALRTLRDKVQANGEAEAREKQIRQDFDHVHEKPERVIGAVAGSADARDALLTFIRTGK